MCDSGSPDEIAHAIKSTVNWTLPSQQARGEQQQANNKLKTRFQNEQVETAQIMKPTADALFSALYFVSNNNSSLIVKPSIFHSTD